MYCKTNYNVNKDYLLRCFELKPYPYENISIEFSKQFQIRDLFENTYTTRKQNAHNVVFVIILVNMSNILQQLCIANIFSYAQTKIDKFIRTEIVYCLRAMQTWQINQIELTNNICVFATNRTIRFLLVNTFATVNKYPYKIVAILCFLIMKSQKFKVPTYLQFFDASTKICYSW